MEYTYRYSDPRTLYLNVTNRCTNRCAFCVRNYRQGLGGAVLWGAGEPDIRLLKDSVQSAGGVEAFSEFVWCGFGEPTFRLDLITEAAGWLRSGGARIRLNTNGHASLIHGRNVIAELSGAVDEVSVSLNAPNLSRYLDLCRPDPNTAAIPSDSLNAESFWEATLVFLSCAPHYLKCVRASVVGSALTEEEITSSQNLARSLGITKFRVR